MTQTSTPPYWQYAIKHLECDEKLAQLIRTLPSLTLTARDDALQTLLRSIVGQQISVSAADSIWQRLEKHLAAINAHNLLSQDVATLKTLGLSTQKANYLRNVAQYFIDNNIDATYWKQRSYSTIKQELISIKGVGIWTIEMFAIFYLLEPDIFPAKDLGILRAMQKIYGKSSMSNIEDMAKVALKWQPYRTVATLYLWRSLDG